MRYFWNALTFLTIIPAFKKYSEGKMNLGGSAIWFPLVGLLIGVITALAFTVLQFILPSVLGSVLTVLVWITLTGGLHLDGLADCCDGMLNPSTADRRLEIMKDPRIGTFGAVGLVFVILLKISAIQSLEVQSIWIAVPLAACIARWLLLWAGFEPMARQDGLGAAFQTGLRRWHLVIAGVLPLILIILAGVPGLVATTFACISTFLISAAASARLGGMTGDVMGCVVEVTEVVVLISLTLPLHVRF